MVVGGLLIVLISAMLAVILLVFWRSRPAVIVPRIRRQRQREWTLVLDANVERIGRLHRMAGEGRPPQHEHDRKRRDHPLSPSRPAAKSRPQVRPARQPVGCVDYNRASILDVDNAAAAGSGRAREGSSGGRPGSREAAACRLPRPSNLHGVGLLVYVALASSGVSANWVDGAWRGC
ncbi:hypothetical protein LXA43DRAFT_23873 [Ganoderma leucocontextum]|nr:hypothetical protein LXA43DRAFT_23873 [Ganoderma leucocontextum]